MLVQPPIQRYKILFAWWGGAGVGQSPSLKQQLCPSVHPIDGINGQFCQAVRAVIRSNPQSRQSLILQSRIISLLSQMLFPADAMQAALESDFLLLSSVPEKSPLYVPKAHVSYCKLKTWHKLTNILSNLKNEITWKTPAEILSYSYAWKFPPANMGHKKIKISNWSIIDWKIGTLIARAKDKL